MSSWEKEEIFSFWRKFWEKSWKIEKHAIKGIQRLSPPPKAGEFFKTIFVIGKKAKEHFYNLWAHIWISGSNLNQFSDILQDFLKYSINLNKIKKHCCKILRTWEKQFWLSKFFEFHEKKSIENWFLMILNLFKMIKKSII